MYLLQDSDRSSAGSPEPATGGGALHEHQMMIDDIKNSRKRRRSPSPDNLHQAKRAAVAQAHLNGTSKCETVSLRKGSLCDPDIDIVILLLEFCA